MGESGFTFRKSKLPFAFSVQTPFQHAALGLSHGRILGLCLGLCVGLLACDDDTNPRPTPVIVDAGSNADVSTDSGTTPDAAVSDTGKVPESWNFPDKFLFGTAIAGFQSDMGCPTLAREACEDPNSDWFAFATNPATVNDKGSYLVGQDPSDVGPGFWELYEPDLDRASKELHNNALRLSIEWSRIFPRSTEGVEGFDALKAVANADAISHYHKLFAAMKARSITPFVTLNHYTLPTWIHDAVGCHQNLDNCSPRGWLDKDRTVREIAKYAGFVAKEFGKEVDLWATLNEPMAVVYPGYIQPNEGRANPPAVMLRSAEARHVLLAMVEAHARMYDAVKAADTDNADDSPESASVGVVFNLTPMAPKDPNSAFDVAGAEAAYYLWNLAFLNAVCLGDYDEKLDGNVTRRDDLAKRMDYFGLNYYNRWVVEGMESPFLPDFSVKTAFNPFTVDTGGIYPRGMYEALTYVKKTYGLPVYVTESGTEYKETPGYNEGYLVDHFRWLLRAVRDGVDVRGYFYWTLQDNYEWNAGMTRALGLYQVDASDKEKKRVMRPTGLAYAAIAEAKGLPQAMVDKHPEPDPGAPSSQKTDATAP